MNTDSLKKPKDELTIRDITDYVFNTDMVVGEPYVKLREMIEAYTTNKIIEATIDELKDLLKSFKDETLYKGYMVEQIILSRMQWISKDGRTHISLADVQDIADRIEKLNAGKALNHRKDEN